MMSPWLSQVNQKLFFARTLLEQAEQGVPASKGGRLGHLEQALCQSVVFQLECAYRQHLREVADIYQCADPDIIATVEQLASALKAVDKHPAEATEMLNLEQQPQSWLWQLLKTWQLFQLLPQMSATADIASPIAVMQVSPGDRDVLPPLTPEVARSWLLALEELVERHRELMVEC